MLVRLFKNVKMSLSLVKPLTKMYKMFSDVIKFVDVSVMSEKRQNFLVDLEKK